MRPPPSRAGAEADKGIRSLTRRYADTGALYERLPEVEAQVRRALALEEAVLVAEMQHDYKSPAHIKDETLCYLIRERVRAGRHEEASVVTEVILRRIAGTIKQRIVGSGIDERHRED